MAKTIELGSGGWRIVNNEDGTAELVSPAGNRALQLNDDGSAEAINAPQNPNDLARNTDLSLNRRPIRPSSVNDNLYPEPGNLQSTIDTAASDGGSIKLLEDENYAEADTIHLPRGVDLDFNGAKMEITGDHHGMTCGGFNTIRQADIVVDQNLSAYTKSGVLLKTSFNGKYGNHTRNSVKIDGRIEGLSDQGAGLHLYDDGTASNGFGLGNRFNLDIKNFSSGLLAEGPQSNSWMNANAFNLHISTCEYAIHQKGFDSFAFQNDIYGSIQTGDASKRVLYNQTGSLKSFNFYGPLWDVPQHVDGTNTFAISGPGIGYHGEHANEVRDWSDGGNNQMITGRKGPTRYFSDPEHSNDWEIDFNDGNWVFSEGGEKIFRFHPQGGVRPVGKGKYIIGAEDLTTRSPETGEFARHNGSNGQPEGMCEEISGSWRHIATNTSF